MVYEGTDAYWLGVLSASVILAVEMLRGGHFKEAEAALARTLRDYSTSASCTDDNTRVEIARVLTTKTPEGGE